MAWARDADTLQAPGMFMFFITNLTNYLLFYFIAMTSESLLLTMTMKMSNDDNQRLATRHCIVIANDNQQCLSEFSFCFVS